MARWFLYSGLVLALSLSAYPSAARTTDGGKSLTPAHVQYLQTEIQRCAQRVNQAGSPEQRGQCQEELCKKLLQAEDYQNALKVATAVYATDGINPERRAAHHFLIAQIHVMQMEASSSVSEMETCWRNAANAAQEVVCQNYPSNWMVGDAASGLLRTLQDSRHMAMVRAKVSKRQTGAPTRDLEAVAKAQSVSLNNSVANKARSIMAGSRSILTGGRQSASVQKVAVQPMAAKLQSRAQRSNGSSDSTGVVASSSTSLSKALGRGGRLRTPIIIDGNSVRAASTESISAASARSKKSTSRSGIGSPSSTTSRSKTGS